MRCGVQFGHGSQRPLDITDDVKEGIFGQEEEKGQGHGIKGTLGWRWNYTCLLKFSGVRSNYGLREQEHWNALKCGSGAVMYAHY